MTFFDNWLKTVKAVIFHPKDFFKDMKTKGGYGEPLRFALVNIFLGALLSLVGLYLTAGSDTGLAKIVETFSLLGLDLLDLSLIWIFGIVLLGAVGLFLSSGIYHIILRLMGAKKGYEATFRIIAYITALNLITWVPMVAILASLYLLYVIFIAFQEVHGLTPGRSAASILLMLVAGFVIGLLIFGIFAGIIFATVLSAQTGGERVAIDNLKSIQSGALCMYSTFDSYGASFDAAEGKLRFEILSTGAEDVNIGQIVVTGADFENTVYTSPDYFDGKISAGGESTIELDYDAGSVGDIMRITVIPADCPENLGIITGSEIA